MPAKSTHTAKYKFWKLRSFHWFEQPEAASAFEAYLKSVSGHAFANNRLR